MKKGLINSFYLTAKSYKMEEVNGKKMTSL